MAHRNLDGHRTICRGGPRWPPCLRCLRGGVDETRGNSYYSPSAGTEQACLSTQRTVKRDLVYEWVPFVFLGRSQKKESLRNEHDGKSEVVQRQQRFWFHHAGGRTEGLLRPSLRDPGQRLQVAGRG